MPPPIRMGVKVKIVLPLSGSSGLGVGEALASAQTQVVDEVQEAFLQRLEVVSQIIVPEH
jgi:hypothetical protein